MSKIDSRPASGFRDYLPAEAQARQALMDRIAVVFERSGFGPIDTPALERLEVLTGGDAEFKKQIYHARITDEDQALGLRFDLTVPMARYIAAHADKLQMPFLRYHIGKVWRGEHSQAGRYREFIQCDADIVGSTSLVADAQVIALVYAVFHELDLGHQVRISISNRKILNGLAEFLQFEPEKSPLVLAAIDKVTKQSWAQVAAELRAKVGLDNQQIDAIQEFLALKGATAEELLEQVQTMLRFGAQSNQGIQDLRELVQHLDALAVPRSAWTLDLAIARGLGYYTGTVFETQLTSAPQYGSVCSGGRYDDLVARFAPLELPGVGLSVGLDRLFAALEELDQVPATANSARVAVLDFDPDCRAEILALTATLRQAGLPTLLYVGHETTLKGQLAWALKTGFPQVILMGKNERERGLVQLKNLALHTQEEIPLPDLIKKLLD